MSVLDYFLNSLIKHLQETQKARARKRKRKGRRVSARKPRKPAKPESLKKKSINSKRKTVSRKGGTVKRPVKKVSKKSVSAPKKKTTARGLAARPKVKAKSSAVKKTKKAITGISGDKKVSREVCIGEITHFFPRIHVVVLKMTGGSISVGNAIRIKGMGIDFVQKIGSLQIESIDVKTASKGQLVGLKVNKIAKVGSKVYKEGR